MEVLHDTATECHLSWDHTVLPSIRHKWTHPTLTPAIQAGTRFTYPGRMEGWVDLVDLIALRPGVEPATFRSRVRRSTNAPPRQPYVVAFCQSQLCIVMNSRHADRRGGDKPRFRDRRSFPMVPSILDAKLECVAMPSVTTCRPILRFYRAMD